MDGAALSCLPRIKLLFVVTEAASTGYWILPHKLGLLGILFALLMKNEPVRLLLALWLHELT
jgi:hypothetical protein